MKLPFLTALILALLLSLFGCGSSSSGTAAPASTPASATGSHKVVLNWTASPSAVVGYNVYRAPSQGSFVQLNSQPIAGLTYTDSTVQPGQTYSYAVAAVDKNGVQSIFSVPAAATIPSP